MPTTKAAQPTPTPDLYAPRVNLGVDGLRHGEHLHPEQEGYATELRDVARAALASNAETVDELRSQVQALASVVFELVRMVEHYDLKSDSRGYPH